MRGNLDLYDIIYGEICSTNFYTSILPLATNPNEVEGPIMAKFRTGTIEEYLKSLQHLLVHSCHTRMLTAYLQNPTDEMLLMKHGETSRQFVLLHFSFKEKPMANYSPGDLVLISKGPVDRIQSEHVIAAVDSCKPPLLTVKTVLKLKEEEPRAKAFSEKMYTDSEWHLRKLLNVSMFVKEYESLQFIEELPLAEALVNPEESDFVQSVYKLNKGLLEQIGTVLDAKQVDVISKAVRRHGIAVITGEAGTGKSEVLAGTILSLMNVIDESELMKPKKYTIEEMLKEDDEDYDDNYIKDPKVKAKLSPWMNPEYSIGKLSAEDLRLEKKSVSYQKAAATDTKMVLKKRDIAECLPPVNILVCCNTSKSLDKLMHKVIKINRIVLLISFHSI